MHLQPITEEEIVAFFLGDPKLYLLGLPNEHITELLTNKKFLNIYNSHFDAIYENDVMVMLLVWEPFTSTSITIHTYVPSKFHHTGMYKKVMNWLKSTVWEPWPHLYKILALPPSSCEHVIKAIKKIGFIQEGCLKNGVEWREHIVDLMIYSLNLKGEK